MNNVNVNSNNLMLFVGHCIIQKARFAVSPYYIVMDLLKSQILMGSDQQKAKYAIITNKNPTSNRRIHDDESTFTFKEGRHIVGHSIIII